MTFEERLQRAETELADANDSGNPERIQRAETRLADLHDEENERG